MNLFYQPLIPDGIRFLDQEESRHCVKVLRYKKGDSISITDGGGAIYDAVIEDANPTQCKFSISNKLIEPQKGFRIHIAIAPTKNQDRIEWFVEKATEFGIDEISFLQADHSEKIFLKRERLLKVAISAMKQSLKSTLPTVGVLVSLREFVARASEHQKFIAFVDESNPVHLKDAAQPGSETLVLIGPEGDFSRDELALSQANGFQKVSLGKSRLRTETAGLAACHILNLVNT